MVGVEYRRAVVANVVKTVHKPSRQGQVKEFRHTAKGVALCLASSVKEKNSRELYKPCDKDNTT